MTVKKIRDLLSGRKLFKVSPETSVREVSRIMAANTVGAVAIVEGGTLKGIATERDIAFRAVGGDLDVDGTPISGIMTFDPVTIGIDDPISNALALKLGDVFRHLPVMDGEDIVGILSYRDIPLDYVMMFEHFREMSAAHADDVA
ncbi:CBS domain protein [Rhodovulum sp. P5]|uniref:CBS domain-containing protein n=1 Tax=Rhodovulum sp. P5 TaxID=1564506 RepID=UPI0009C2C1BA|nr:CBS domain-containing protein [Rhodovulum sp. P5]ARE40216.1 CBS domain protein [Rhodovulum sp. P5]